MKGVVACPQPWAAEVGARVLESGGNAFDAALATAFMQWVWDPFMCGPGGMGVAHVWDARSGEHKAVEFAARASSKVREDMWLDGLRSRTEVSHLYVFDDFRNELGHTSVMVPTAVAGMAEVHRRYCTLSWSELLEPAIAQAKQGLPVHTSFMEWVRTPYAPGAPGALDRMRATDECARVFLKPDGTVPGPGDVIQMDGMASTLETLAQKGAREFYEGEMAGLMAADIEANGGFVTLDDLKHYRPRIHEPLIGTYRNHRIATVRPPHTGMTVLQLFKLIEPLDLLSMGHNSPDYLHAVASAMALAHRDRLEYNADAEFAHVPIDETVLEPARLARQREQMLRSARSGAAAALETGHTTNVCVADDQGSMIALTHTLGWASGAVTPGLGFVYNNGMNLADPQPGNPNSIAPGKARASNMVPTLVFDGDTPTHAIGALGGAVIVSAVFQAAVNALDFGMSATEAVQAPRLHCEGGKVFLEARIRGDYAAELERLGHRVDRPPAPLSPIMARAQLVSRDRDGTLDAGSDPRGGGGGVPSPEHEPPCLAGSENSI